MRLVVLLVAAFVVVLTNAEGLRHQIELARAADHVQIMDLKKKSGKKGSKHHGHKKKKKHHHGNSKKKKKHHHGKKKQEAKKAEEPATVGTVA